MSVHTKKRPTKLLKLVAENGDVYELPRAKVLELKKYKAANVSADDAFNDLNTKFTKSGALLKGLRLRENLNQTDFGNLFNITQGDISKLEKGELSLGKDRAKKIAKKFDLDYRLLL